MKIGDLAHDLEPYILEIIEHSAFSGSSSSSGTASGFAPSPHNLFGEHHNGVLDRTQAPWIAADIQSSINAHSIDPDAHTFLTTLQITSTGATAFQVGNGSTGYAKIGGAGWYDDGVYFSPIGTRAFYVRAATPNSYIYSPNIYLGSTSGTAVHLRGNSVDADSWGITSAGAAFFAALDVSQSSTFGASTIRMIYHSTPSPHSHLVVNPTGTWSLDEQFGVDIDDNLLVRGYIVGKHALQIKDAIMLVHYDGPTPYQNNYSGELNGHMGQIGTPFGSYAFREGKFGKALLTHGSGASSNFCPNPSFEVDATGVSIEYNTGTLSGGRTLSASWIGGASYVITASAASSYVFNAPHVHMPQSAATTNWTTGATAYVSAYVKGSGTFRFIFEDSGQNFRAFVDKTLTGSWSRVTVGATNTSGVIYSNYKMAVLPLGAGTCYIDGVQYETKTWVSAYFDGSFGSGYSWVGTPHLSASSTTGGYIQYSATNIAVDSDWTVSCWVYRDPNSKHDWGYTWFTNTYSGVDGQNALYYNSANIDAISGVLVAGPTTPGWYHYVVVASGVSRTAYRNGILMGTSTSGTSVGTTFTVQSDNGVDDFSIINRALTDDEVRAIYESDAPIFAETSTFQFRAGQNLVWADTDGLWTIDTSGNAVFGVYGNEAATKTWGGLNLDVGDILIGSATRGGYMFWDNSAATIAIRGSVTIDQASSLTGSGTLKIGSGTKDSTLNGWQFDTGEIVGQSAGVDQVVLSNTTGKLTAGAGSVTLDSTGVWFSAGSNDVNKVRWLSSSTRIGQMYTVVSGATEMVLEGKGLNSGSAANLRLLATHGDGSTTHSSSITMAASATTPAIYLSAAANTLATFANGDIYFASATTIEQTAGSGGIPVLELAQNDSTGPVLSFTAASGSGKSIDTAALGSYYGKFRVSVNGTSKYVGLYNS